MGGTAREMLEGAALAAALTVVLGWPLAATIREAGRGSEAATGSGLIEPYPADDGGAGGVARPLGLARETARLVLATAALAVAVLTAGEMTVTDLLVVRTYAEEAYVQFQLGHGPGAAAAVALPPLAVLGGLVFLAARSLLRADPARIPTADTRVRLWGL